MPLLRIRAPAKVNLGLRILARRHDGFHQLESVFAPVDLADQLEIELVRAAAPEVRLELCGEDAGIPADGDNLASRAARCFLAWTGLSCAAEIRLVKRVPAAAGLGGGSSDAGAVLRGLAALRPGALSPGSLARLALELGADVPFFLDPEPALVTGIGERRTPLPAAAGLNLLLVNPRLPLATRAVYEAYDALGTPRAEAASEPDLPPLLEAWAGTRPPEICQLDGLLGNDLEPAAVRLCPPIARLRRHLRDAGAQAVGMSGSGPTLFGVFEDAPRARAARARLGAACWARVAVTVRTR